jgi:hypothetical protein
MGYKGENNPLLTEDSNMSRAALRRLSDVTGDIELEYIRNIRGNRFLDDTPNDIPPLHSNLSSAEAKGDSNADPLTVSGIQSSFPYSKIMLGFDTSSSVILAGNWMYSTGAVTLNVAPESVVLSTLREPVLVFTTPSLPLERAAIC